MQMPDYDQFFTAYVGFYNDALAEKSNGAMRDSYAEFIVGASPGTVMGGANDAKYGKVLEQGFDFYRKIGVQRMNLVKVEASEIMEGHDLARVSFSADMRRKDGEEFPIDFEIAYILQRRDGGPKIFASISEDEIKLFRKLGLVDDDGKPI